MTSAPLKPIPPNFEVGYEDGVWLIASELYPDEDQGPDFDAGLSFFLMFTTYHLGPVPKGMSEESPKNLMGVEVVYAENEFVEDIWGLRINKYVDLGTVRGRKQIKKMKKRGEFNHIDAVYGEGNVKYVGQMANFDDLAKAILKYVARNFKPSGLDEERAEIIQYYRPLEIPETEKAWYSDGYWLEKDSFEINTGQYIDLLPVSDEYPATAVVFTCSNYLTGNPAELGVFMIVYEELESSFAGSYSMETFDAFPYETDFRFLGFIGPEYQIPSLRSIEVFLGANEILWNSYANTYTDWMYAGKVNSFSDLRPSIVEAILGWDDAERVRKMNIFK